MRIFKPASDYNFFHFKCKIKGQLNFNFFSRVTDKNFKISEGALPPKAPPGYGPGYWFMCKAQRPTQ